MRPRDFRRDLREAGVCESCGGLEEVGHREVWGCWEGGVVVMGIKMLFEENECDCERPGRGLKFLQLPQGISSEAIFACGFG